MEISRDFYWVGAIDWNVRLFHDFLSTSTGSTYNAYIAIDEKITLFDTVYRPFKEELIENISAIVAPSDINYIVVNHVEMDHSGSLPHIMDIAKPEKLFCSKMGKKALIEHFHREDWPYEVVEDGQEISIGKKSIRFIESRMLHWPDSMLSYIKEDGILISNDIFGQHIATPER
ncbi:MAG: MBL fold metallo-hydrolase, partial [Nitrospirae bacterium]